MEANILEKERVIHKGCSITVNETYEYGRFKELDGNRTISTHHVAEIVSSMRQKYLITPILVNERFEVIDDG